MPERRSSRRRWLTALLASLLAHACGGLLFAWLSPSRPARPERPRPTAIRVTYRSPAPKPPPASKPPATARPAPPREDAPPPPIAERRPPKPAPTDAPRSDAPTAATATPRTDVPTAASDLPRINVPTAASDVPRRDVPTVASDVPRADAPTARLLPNPDLPVASAPDIATSSGPQAPTAPRDLVGEAVAETLARGKVDRGLVHPYYSQVGKALLKAWTPDKAITRKGLKGFLEQGGENAKIWSRIWLENAKAYGATGAAVQDTSGADRLLPGGDDGLLVRSAMRRKAREQFRATRRATLRVVQDRDGKLVEVTLVSPSNDAEVDREAVADVRQAAQALPPPPPEALGNKSRLVSLWQFELIISISPPLPTFSFEFDEVLGFGDVRVPLDRRVYKRVRLLSAE